MQPSDEDWMLRAIELGRRGRPAPNPHVGAVLTRAGRLISGGHHEKAGTAHAEVNAIANAQGDTQGTTLYVTLEPCNHHGRTGPCTEAILKAGITRVVVGATDPNPHVRGGGIERLRAAGVEVTTHVMAASAEELVAPWAKVQTTGMPSVLLSTGPGSRVVPPEMDALWIATEEMDAALPPAAPLTVVAAPGTELLRRVARRSTSDRWLVFCPEARHAEYMLASGAAAITVVPLPYQDGTPLPLRLALRELPRHGVVTLFVDAEPLLEQGLCDEGLVDGHVERQLDRKVGT
ncbi:bifunctional diaminohydroxyphosphoribosylaminopyrimidine deaminase/5-amino-6-(5-phosphoribosylamino)uracil reductase RibD [Corallococcus terminator]|uniref:diaminohydroxyphosphoribosylaminopyrimidine deaminase n=1 Tax=Corallococcus terminator TaxID=2316733 RepID=A0A3A8IJ70_9BACT|nr:bifunctional diaminohydroxyphosphoribosylaminopyrimidine deaminase/5-amino-6-(5-phosphoribosylamino)uracil reductase RibD [Corallococcus terminator]